EKLARSSGAATDSIRKAAIDQTTIKTLNFTNVRVMQGSSKPGLLKLSNFDFSYSFSQTPHISPVITENKITRQRMGFGYTYVGQSSF
ncbi:hypothetical protein ABTK05_20555, partial [Acinetobacter baumannii]